MSYETKQREVLIKFFKKNKDKSFTAGEIADVLKDDNISISAIFRNIAELEKLGKIKKVNKVGEKARCFQFVDCEKCKGHIHVACKNCGKTLHLSDDDSNLLSKKLLSDFNFCLDKDDTIIYGTCKKCAKRQG